MPIDQYTGLWYDDGTDSPEDYGGLDAGGADPLGLNSNMFLMPQMSPDYSTSKWNFGQEQPVGQMTINRQLTGTKNAINLMMDPRTMWMAQVATGQPVFDQNALAGLDASGMPYMGDGGGGGGGGGFSTDYGFKPVFTTPNYNDLASSDDPTAQLIIDGIKSKQPPAVIKNSLRANNPGLTDDQLFAWDDQIDAAYEEFNAKERNDQLGLLQGAGAPQQTGVQKWLSEYGYINPQETYTPENLPSDIDLSPADAQTNRYLQMSTQAGNAGVANEDQLRRLNAEINITSPIIRAAERQADVDTLFGPLRRQRAATEPSTVTTRSSIPGASSGGFRIGRQSNQSNRASEPSRAQRRALGRYTRGLFWIRGGGERGGGGQAMTRRQRSQRQVLSRDAQRDRAYQHEYRRQASDSDRAYRTLAALNLTSQGRTPARDAQRTLINYLRSSGIGI